MSAASARGVRRPSRVVRVVVAVAAMGAWAVGTNITALGASSAKAVVVSTMKTSAYGTILVAGHTVYTLKPSSTPCTATCLVYWPAVLLPPGVTRAVAGPGVSAAKLGTRRLSSGRLQVTYGGRALYWFALDKAAGQVKGNITDTWGTWSVVVIKKPAVGSTTTTTVQTTTTAAGGGGGIGF